MEYGLKIITSETLAMGLNRFIDQHETCNCDNGELYLVCMMIKRFTGHLYKLFLSDSTSSFAIKYLIEQYVLLLGTGFSSLILKTLQFIHIQIVIYLNGAIELK